MRLHTDILTRPDIFDAARLAGIAVVHAERKGSRSRARAWDVAFTGSSSYGGQYGHLDYSAATWDEWGIVLGVLFERDPRMIAGGKSGYVGAVDYDWQTGSRFTRRDHLPAHVVRVLTPAEQHARHRWNYQREESVTGSYAVHTCKCGAIRRFLLGGTTREDIGLDMPTIESAVVAARIGVTADRVTVDGDRYTVAGAVGGPREVADLPR